MLLLLPCAWGETTTRTASHSIIPKHLFSSTLILASSSLSEPVNRSS